ncbi:MAG: copper resistance protein CopD [Streptosporangiales bacterium]|nr:copper resistance protein CopD [Streptosporangiales bacterium]
MPDVRSGRPVRDVRDVREVARLAVGAVVVTVVTLIAALVLTGAVAPRVLPGLPDAGPLTRWGLPVSRLLTDVTAVLTLGALLAAAAFLPSRDGELSDTARWYLRGASWSALAWAVAAAGNLVFQLSDILGLSPSAVLGNQLTSYAGSVSQGIALMLVILLATAIALFARTAASASGALGLLALALVALLPPPLTGHSSSSPNHELAVTGLALHVLAVSLWVGGLAAVVVHGLLGQDRLRDAAGRFSRMALWCYAGVAVGGVASALTRLPSVEALFTTSYGLLILLKTAGFAALGVLGWWHRERTLPVIDRGRGPFLRLAAVEVLIMSAVMALAVVLARTAPPEPTGVGGSPAEELLGFPEPPPLSLGGLVTLWRPDLFFILVVTAGTGLYLAAVLRLRRRGDAWPVGRTVSWVVGMVTVAVCTLTGVATYAQILFSVHMTEHMVLSMLSPIFLVLGAPVTLALRALRPAAVRGDRGPREWLTAALHSRFTAVVAHPLVATAIFIVSTYAVYLTPLFEALMRTHLGHLLMLVHFMASGTLFFWVLIGIDPAPRRLPYIARLGMLFVTMPFHAFFGIALMSMTAPVAATWYDAVRPGWAGPLVGDVQTGGGIAWAFGEVPTLIVLVALIFQWARDDERQARRHERKAGTARAKSDEDLDAYNAYLAGLDRRDHQDTR